MRVKERERTKINQLDLPYSDVPVVSGARGNVGYWLERDRSCLTFSTVSHTLSPNLDKLWLITLVEMHHYDHL